MYIIEASDSFSSYNIYINNSFKDFFSIFNNYIEPNKKFFIITDNNIKQLYDNIIQEFKNRCNVFTYIFSSGEVSKNYNTVSEIYSFLLDNDADKDSIIIALGGGVVGDIAGFAASTFMRGIRFINIPTTVISQVDSSIGGKVGYNFNGVKNSIGCFYNPEFVYVSVDFLRTLNKELIIDGMGEIIKYGLINNKSLIDFIDLNYKDIIDIRGDFFFNIIKDCLTIKAEVISQDFRDKDIRNTLNFGHTVGHGIEVSSNYNVSHGAAVALGMLTALKLSESKFNLSCEVYKFVESLYKKLGLPTRHKVDNYASFLYAIKHDKKNTDEIKFVLLEEIGQCKTKVSVDENELYLALENSIFKKS